MPEIKVIKFPEGRYEGEVDENDVPHGEGEFEYPGNDDLERQVSHPIGFLTSHSLRAAIFRFTLDNLTRKKLMDADCCDGGRATRGGFTGLHDRNRRKGKNQLTHLRK